MTLTDRAGSQHVQICYRLNTHGVPHDFQFCKHLFSMFLYLENPARAGGAWPNLGQAALSLGSMWLVY
jgi:hypothetical protein